MTTFQVRKYKQSAIKYALLCVIAIIAIYQSNLPFIVIIIPMLIIIIAYFSIKNSNKLIKKLQFKKSIGDYYEKQVGKLFENNGYRVFYRGLKLGLKDGGIDLQAYKDNEIVLIQCKNHKNNITADLLKKFLNDCYCYEQNNKKFLSHKNIKRAFYSNSQLDYQARIFLNNNTDKLLFQRVISHKIKRKRTTNDKISTKNHK